MSSGTWSSAVPSPAISELLEEPPDEFDLDIRWGELGPAACWDAYLPTAREAPGETCDSNAATCPDTCHATCPDTCRATCQDTCARTCDEIGSCGAGTCAGTHCFTCRSGCERP
jgi:hypothetical protein